MHHYERIVVRVVYLRALYLGESVVQVQRVEIIGPFQQVYLRIPWVDNINPGNAHMADRAHIEVAWRVWHYGPRRARACLRSRRYRRRYGYRRLHSRAIIPGAVRAFGLRVECRGIAHYA